MFKEASTNTVHQLDTEFSPRNDKNKQCNIKNEKNVIYRSRTEPSKEKPIEAQPRKRGGDNIIAAFARKLADVWDCLNPDYLITKLKMIEPGVSNELTWSEYNWHTSSKQWIPFIQFVKAQIRQAFYLPFSIVNVKQYNLQIVDCEEHSGLKFMGSFIMFSYR